MDPPRFKHAMATAGFAVFERIVPERLLAALRRDIPDRIAACGDWRRRNGIDEGMEGVAHHVVGGADSLNEFLCTPFIDDYLHAYFEGAYILNSYGALDNLPLSSRSYAHGQRFHRDVRTYSGPFRLMANMLVMVDDFSIENGATKIVPGSHRDPRMPADADMEAAAIRLVGSAGSIVLFDSNLWHSAAPNLSGARRMALTLTFTRPFFKQQMDYPRLLGDDFPRDDRMRQLLGYNARVPSNYDEWYQPPERRMYKPGQG